mmetsp:Transcript_39009/g.94422  ORF Transcript_39009/g.94422 Transcript_39009/m.94422 type:complete len:286 (-) Transcript_39009:220-1077(-)|eukprot:CAMPEP_0113492884 /NCGR_PEP_ID=MMETSP0014_2-20120614/28307_1 /TAXON_ID=2857 /ORGANISM="Nitzschia sp." /LENGTH=285 /DNA_ID=CAMNT_0000386731 /DNA_START=103 /DNA_END=960 /DNA_ORIENTATION=+ /assembly_acc=CAM_ASM_000159
MKFSTGSLSFLLLSCASAPSTVSAFQQQLLSSASSSLTSLHAAGDDRRAFVQNGAAMLFGLGLSSAVSPASASLLDEFGSDPSKIDNTPKKVAREAAKVVAKTESSLEPNLRSNYYYPTNKKRYLPRIKKCNDAIPSAAEMIGTGDWDGAADFANKIADDTVLPMKLYTSSLLGGGTNVKVAFAKDMNQAATDFEKAQKQLSKAIAKKDQEKSSRALEDLSSALMSYRTAGKLLGADGGGDIPSVDEIRRSACRVQGRTFEQKVKARDQRLAQAATATAATALSP